MGQPTHWHVNLFLPDVCQNGNINLFEWTHVSVTQNGAGTQHYIVLSQNRHCV
jgi:hypothetical protein